MNDLLVSGEPSWDTTRNRSWRKIFYRGNDLAQNHCYVVSDSTGGAFCATEHLIILGYIRIAFLYNQDADFRNPSVKDRYIGYCKALSEYDLAFDESWVCGLEPETLDTNLKTSYRCTTVIWSAATDQKRSLQSMATTALNLMNVACQLGPSIPGELAVLGFDNIKEAGQFQVPLITINVHRTDIWGRSCVPVDRQDRRP
jgi:DNA-binding LacI/PurR family transcriptional regulator